MYYYNSPPGYSQPSQYRSSPAGPPPSSYHAYASTPSKSRTHHRTTSYDEPGYGYTSRRPPAYHAYSYPSYDTSTGYTYTTPRKSSENVSHKTERPRPKTAARDSAKQYSYSFGASPQKSSKKSSHGFSIRVDGFDEGGCFYYEKYPHDRSPPPPYNRTGDHYVRTGYDADYSGYYQAPPDYSSPHAYSRHKSSSTRARATSYSTPRSKGHKDPNKSHPAAAARPPPRQVTPQDLYKHEIPAGYSHKNWDPDEEPILLLGSVFDANSIGKWIYDWTIYRCGPTAPMADVAGDLWLLLIQLASKMKRAEEGILRISDIEDQELVEDFIESGERLWQRFSSILKICEAHMWKYIRKESAAKKSKNPTSVTSNSGCVFVDVIFGRDGQLENAEKLMTGMRLWTMRFDANCDGILRHPN